jgi:hypothetical protein
MKVAVWAPNGSGHRLNYVSILQAGTLKHGHSFILLVTKETLASQEWVLRDAEFKNTEVFKISNLSEAFSFCVEKGISKLVIPDGDSEVLRLLQLRQKLKNIHISLLLMRPRPQAGFASHFNFLLKYLFVHYLAHYGNISAFELASAKSSWWKMFAFKQIRDPSDNIALPKDFEPNFASELQEKIVFSILGVIDERKNPLAVIEGFRAARISNSVLVVAGKFSENVQTSLNSFVESSEDVILINRQLSDLEFSWLLKNSNALVCIYDNIGSSGIVTNAEDYGNVVIGGGNSRTVEELRILSSRFVAVGDKNPKTIAKALILASEFQTENNKISNLEVKNLSDLI